MALRQQVIELMEQNFCRGRNLGLADGDSFLEFGIIDSLGMMELVNLIARKFNVTVEDAELMPENLDSIDALSRFLASKGAGDCPAN
jgi:acyl carrier protein